MEILILFKALFLGLVEGLTEFLPISSTAHLIIVGEWLHFNDEAGKAFEIVIQFGAILAVCWYFRVKIFSLLRHWRTTETQTFTANILVAFLPAAVIGFLTHGWIKEHLFSTSTVAWAMLLGGVVILVIERFKPAPRFHDAFSLSWKLALAIGFCQALAMIPGVSRSGATIMGALLLGLDRRAATEFSFYLAIPTIAAASLFEMVKNIHAFTPDAWLLLAVGFASAFLSALAVVHWLLRFVSRHNFNGFGWYRIVTGLALLVWVLA